MKRREFLQQMAALAAFGFTSGLYAAPASSPRLLFVFLRGGYDSNNLLVPYASDYYYETRPNIAIARPDTANTASAIALNSDWGLCPALRDSIAPLYARQEVAFIPFAGTDNLSRSHFATQDDVEKGLPENARITARSGFLGRLSTELHGANPISFTSSLPLIFQGKTEVPNISLMTSQRGGLNKQQAEALLRMYEGDPLHEAVSDGLQLRQEISSEFAGEMMSSSRNAVSTRGFERQAQRIAVMMKERYRLGFVDIGGWDTHVNQGGASGALSNKLSELGRGLVSYAEAMGDEWKNTVVVVASEFGRTFRENGNKGTDHGHGTVYWVLGGSINGGEIAGKQTKITAGNLFQNRDYPVLNNYRSVLAGLIQPMWGLSNEAMTRIFPDARPDKLGII